MSNRPTDLVPAVNDLTEAIDALRGVIERFTEGSAFHQDRPGLIQAIDELSKKLDQATKKP